MISEEVVARVATSLGISTNKARRLALTALPAGFVRSLLPGVVLVEGTTDEAVFAELLPVPVLAVGGKHVLPLAVAVTRAHDCRVSLVIVDGDDDVHRAQHGTQRVLDELPDVPTIVLPGDLEDVLATWPSFLDALQRNSSDLTSKDASAYATAARAATRADLPASLESVIMHAVGRPDPSPGPGAG